MKNAAAEEITVVCQQFGLTCLQFWSEHKEVINKNEKKRWKTQIVNFYIPIDSHHSAGTYQSTVKVTGKKKARECVGAPPLVAQPLLASRRFLTLGSLMAKDKKSPRKIKSKNKVSELPISNFEDGSKATPLKLELS